MSFSTCSSFSTNYWTLDDSTMEPSRPAMQPKSVQVLGAQTPVSLSTSIRGNRGSGGLAAGMAGSVPGIGGTQSEKEIRQCLNDCMASSYLERVRSLEADHQELKCKVQEHLEKKGPRSETGGIISGPSRT